MSAVPCASVLKPLYAWVAGPSMRSEAEAAIVYSDNSATDALIEASGGLTAVLEDITMRTGVRWELGETWGRVPINGLSLTVAYSAMMFHRDPWTRAISDVMAAVTTAQRFGVPAGIPLKAGWDLDERTGELLTHLVVLGSHRARAQVTHVPISTRDQRAWRRTLDAGGPDAVIGMHLKVARDHLHAFLGANTWSAAA